MNQYTEEELKEALKVVTSSIRNCEKCIPNLQRVHLRTPFLKIE